MTDDLQAPSPERLPPEVRASVESACTVLREAGGRAFVVGGCVRDLFLGLPAKDADIEVYQLEAAAVEKALRRRFALDAVGRAFGVFKLRGVEIDVALPRRESKTGPGHTGFAVTGDPHMPVEEAAARRDFTVNALLWDPLTGEVLDPLGGRADLHRGLLRHAGTAFAEDPLRVLRAMQLVARFGFTVAPETVALCRTLSMDELSPERVFGEWEKLLTRGVHPSRGLAFLRDCGWVRFFPELEALIDCAQDPQWHPEGDVWTHTLHCLDAFAHGRIGDRWEDLVVGLAVLCHDFGKPATTALDPETGRLRALGHESAGVAPAENFLRRMTNHQALIEAVLPLVETHMRPAQLHEAQAGDSAIRRLARKVGRIDRLVRVAAADSGGRPPLPPDVAPGEWLLARAEKLAVQDRAPEALLQGRDLIELGYTPGPAFGPVLEAAYEAQLDGAFTTHGEATAWLRTYVQKHPLDRHTGN